MATIKRNASAHWSGSGKEGKGTIATQSGVLSETPYSFSRRFGEEKGTNPEELIGAAHAGCFTMALAFQLTGAGQPPESLAHQGRRVARTGRGWLEDCRREADDPRPRCRACRKRIS